MMTKLKFALTGLMAATALIAPASAQGLFDFEPAEGNWYVSGFLGASFTTDIEVDVPVPEVPAAFTELDAELSTAVYFGGAVGGRLPFKSFFGLIQPRLEVEVSYFDTEVDEVTVGTDVFGSEALGGIGAVDVLFVLANSYADFIWQDDQFLVPYIGGGLGVGIVEGTANFAGTSTLGVLADVSDKVEVYTEARYFRIYGAGNVEDFGFDDGFDLDGFTLTAGARFKF